MNGCMGYILEADLSSGMVTKTKVPEAIYESVLAGKGLGVWYLLNNMPADTDALGPDNILGFTSGALTGSGTLFAGRCTVVGKSPLTGGWGDANIGGYLAPAIKQCGVDAIFFKGKAKKPVYFYMDNGHAELRSAEEYRGLDATQTEECLTQDACIKKKPRIAAIGRAGEKLSLMAGICTDAGRIAARSGLGAVMGSKNLKAVVLAGSKTIQAAHRNRVIDLNKSLAKKVKGASLPGFVSGSLLQYSGLFMGALPFAFPMDGSVQIAALRRWGTAVNEPIGLRNGDAPVKNWAGTLRDDKRMAKGLLPEKAAGLEEHKYHCYSCPMGCGGVLNISGIFGGEFSHTHKPEYETVNQFGGLILNTDYDAIFYINELLNRAGMDSISCGGTVAFAVDCYENGILTNEDTDGLELRWGNTEAIVALVKKIIERDGIGDLLADGTKKAAERLGRGSERYAIHVGGQEPAAHDSRKDPGLAVHYAADPAPGKHTIGTDFMYSLMSLWDICSWAPPVKVHLINEDYQATSETALRTVANACYSMLFDALGCCYYAEMTGVHTYKAIDYANAVFGYTKNGDDYMQIGKRIQTMKQLFNIKHGIDPNTITLPSRMVGAPPLKNGPLKGRQLPHIEEQIHLHRRHFGWDEKTGIPTQKTITELGIEPLLTKEISDEGT